MNIRNILIALPSELHLRRRRETSRIFFWTARHVYLVNTAVGV